MDNDPTPMCFDISEIQCSSIYLQRAAYILPAYSVSAAIVFSVWLFLFVSSRLFSLNHTPSTVLSTVLPTDMSSHTINHYPSFLYKSCTYQRVSLSMLSSSLLLYHYPPLAPSFLSVTHTITVLSKYIPYPTKSCINPSPIEWLHLFSPLVIHSQTTPSPLLSLLYVYHTFTQYIYQSSNCMASTSFFHLTTLLYNSVLVGGPIHNNTPSHTIPHHVIPVVCYTHSHKWVDMQLPYLIYPLPRGLSREHHIYYIWTLCYFTQVLHTCNSH